MITFLEISGQASTLNMFVISAMVLLGMGGYAALSFGLLVVDCKIQAHAQNEQGKLIQIRPHENNWSDAESTLEEYKKVV